jgi:sugar phosphate permease
VRNRAKTQSLAGQLPYHLSSVRKVSLGPRNREEHTIFAGSKTLSRKHLLLFVFITYSLAYLDRANFGFGAAAGMSATLNITPERTALLSALFFLGYFFFQVPSATLARRFSATRLVFFTLLAWGIFAALTGVIRSFWLLALDRFLLGIAESAIFPAMLILLTHWFTRQERGRANTFLILGNPVTVLWMSALTGFLIERLGWQRTFIVEGLPSIAWAFAWIALVRDHPKQASWMNPTEARDLQTQLDREQSELTSNTPLRQTLLRPDVLLLSLQYFLWSIGVYGFILWLPTIVRRGGNLSMTNTGLLSAIPYGAAILFMLVAAHLSDRTMRRRQIVWPFLLLAGIAMLGSYVFNNYSFPAAFACLVLAGGCMYAPYGPFFSILPERIGRHAAGEAMALVNCCGALGSFSGSYIVGLLDARTHSSRAGFLFMASALILSAIVLIRELPSPCTNPIVEPSDPTARKAEAQ